MCMGSGTINKNHSAIYDSVNFSISNFINNILPVNHEVKENAYPEKKVLVILGQL